MTDYQDDLADDRYGYDADDCDHADYEVDWEGRAECNCGKRWWLGADEYNAYMAAASLWSEDHDRMQRREQSWWMSAWRWCQQWVFISPFGHAQGPFADDEIPF